MQIKQAVRQVKYHFASVIFMQEDLYNWFFWDQWIISKCHKPLHFELNDVVTVKENTHGRIF